MTDPLRDPKKPAGPSWQRVAVWIVVAGIAIWLIVSGISGIIAKGG